MSFFHRSESDVEFGVLAGWIPCRRNPQSMYWHFVKVRFNTESNLRAFKTAFKEMGML